VNLDEKLPLLTGVDYWQTRPAPALGLRSLFLADGPHGVRRAPSGTSVGFGDALPATCFSTAAALACTWDPELFAEIGAALGARPARSGWTCCSARA